MKKRIIYLIALVLTYAGTSCQQIGKNVKLKTDVDSVSYAIGYMVGSNNNRQLKNTPGGEKLNLDIISAAFTSITKGEESKLTDEEANKVIRNYFEKIRKEEAQKGLEKGNKFLEKNGKRKEVTTTESGLQYEVLKQGNGPKPTTEDKVKVHYHGTLIDGKVFDSSVDRGKPTSFPVTGVIKGWIEGLQLMNVGSKYKFYIPGNLAYGERRQGKDIGPNETLIFEVELLEILPKDKKK